MTEVRANVPVPDLWELEIGPVRGHVSVYVEFRAS